MLTIRTATVSDFDHLTALLRTLFATETDFAFDETVQRRGLAMMLDSPRARILVADVPGAGVVGMCAGQLTMSTAEGGLSLLIEDVVVEQAWRGRGIGGRLLEEIGTWGRDKGAFRSQLLADRDNAPALRFYAGRGWEATALMCLRKRG